MTLERRILVVEDEYHIAMDIKDALEDAGFGVIGPVPSVAEALQLLREHRDVNGAVLDINLGREKVYPVCEALKSRKVPFLFATGYNIEDVPDAYRQVPRLEKPVIVAQLIRALAPGAGS